MPPPSFAAAYRPPASHQSFLTRQQTRARKRKRQREGEGDRGAPGSEEDGADEPSSPPDQPRPPHPPNTQDPHHVAGWPRERRLPARTFPHATAKDPARPLLSVEAELAGLNPPIYAAKAVADHPAASFRRRHLDNLTAILHRCMLRHDWQRASRVWALLLRTAIDGNGPDLRRHGRWLVGAELLLRRTGTEQAPGQRDENAEHRASGPMPAGVDVGCGMAREYYERLILQFPHRHNMPQSSFSARVVYPALFNVWMYEVQARAERARDGQVSEEAPCALDHAHRVLSDETDPQRPLRQSKARELREAESIAHRLDELLRSPPYDAMPELLELRAMISLWLCDLHQAVAATRASSHGGISDAHGDTDIRHSDRQHQMLAHQERERAKKVLRGMAAAGMTLSDVSRAVLDEEPTTIDTARRGGG